jgi:hypothetical protein
LYGAETVNKACDAYDALGGWFAKCGLEESVQKGVAPTTRMEINFRHYSLDGFGAISCALDLNPMGKTRSVNNLSPHWNPTKCKSPGSIGICLYALFKSFLKTRQLAPYCC